jgi:hypothetical protein
MGKKLEIGHACYQLPNLRWVPEFWLNHFTGEVMLSQLCLDPCVDLSFETKQGVEQRNRELATNWRDAHCPDAKLFERRAEQN